LKGGRDAIARKKGLVEGLPDHQPAVLPALVVGRQDLIDPQLPLENG
jgi:hypothetical protein